jgi:hypothetical protein
MPFTGAGSSRFMAAPRPIACLLTAQLLVTRLQPNPSGRLATSASDRMIIEVDNYGTERMKEEEKGIRGSKRMRSRHTFLSWSWSWSWGFSKCGPRPSYGALGGDRVQHARSGRGAFCISLSQPCFDVVR